jgi:VanZ family protein
VAPRRSIRWSIAAVVLAGYWLALFVATHIPLRDVAPIAGLDKLFHALAYAGLAFLLAAVAGLFGRFSWRGYLVVLLLIAGYGALDEAVQALVPGRTADRLDWLADMVGCLLGLSVHAACFSLTHRRSRSQP